MDETTPPKFRPSPTLARLYPEVEAGGFTRADGFVEFYSRVNALLEDDAEVLDFGAGRGLWATENLAPFHRQLRAIEKRAKRVVGVDVDQVVLENPTLAEAQVIGPGGPIPYTTPASTWSSPTTCSSTSTSRQRRRSPASSCECCVRAVGWRRGRRTSGA